MLKQIKFYLIALLLLCYQSSALFGQLYLTENTIKINYLMQLINNFYVDTVNDNQLSDAAVMAILEKLDPHSTYIPKSEVQEVTENMQGNFEGIGVTFNVMTDTIYVISTIPGGPSEKVGILAGDRIVEINSENVAGVEISSKGVRDRLLGEKGTKVKVGIIRRNVPNLLYFTIVRDKIPIYSLDASYMVTDSIGYIKLNRFAMTTNDEFNTAFETLKKQNLKHLILDLSGNGGGYLEVAVMLADQFLKSNQMIVYTKGMRSRSQEFKASTEGNFETGKLIILIDEGSASASEIVSGAVQDWDRGVIVGRRSFGKGLVQRPFSLTDSSMIRLTIAKYYTPTGRLIQKPYENGSSEYSKDIINRYNKGELINEDSIHFPENEKFKTLINSRTVYGGGGIMPDYFVPLDTGKVTQYYRELISKGVLNQYILNYVDNNRKKLKKEYPAFALYRKNFTIDDKMLKTMNELATKEKIEFNEEQFNESKDDITMLLKAYIARDLWSSSEFYEIFNQKNNSLQKAVEILNNADMYEKKLNRK